MVLIDKIKEETKRLLDQKKVDIIIGYTKGTLPLRSTPIFIRDPKDTDSLIFDLTCSNNLSLYAKRFKGKVGIITKGCDGRSLVSLVVDRQINKDDLLIIGVPCNGVIDHRKLYDRLDSHEIIDYSFLEDKLVIKGQGFEKNLNTFDLLSDSCQSCTMKSPPVYDLLIGQEAKEEKGSIEILEAFKEKTQEERWKFFEKESSKCIRCYACRQVCPSCFCEYCIVDRTRPLWFGKTLDPSDTMIFHLIRAYHTAGRCVDCGACIRACPMGVNLRLLNKRLEEEIVERFGFRPGIDLTEPAPLSAYKEGDPQEFIM